MLCINRVMTILCYDYEYEMFLLRHKEIQYKFPIAMLINTVSANIFLFKQIKYAMFRVHKYNVTHNITFYKTI